MWIILLVNFQNFPILAKYFWKILIFFFAKSWNIFGKFKFFEGENIFNFFYDFKCILFHTYIEIHICNDIVRNLHVEDLSKNTFAFTIIQIIQSFIWSFQIIRLPLQFSQVLTSVSPYLLAMHTQLPKLRGVLFLYWSVFIVPHLVVKKSKKVDFCKKMTILSILKRPPPASIWTFWQSDFACSGHGTWACLCAMFWGVLDIFRGQKVQKSAIFDDFLDFSQPLFTRIWNHIHQRTPYYIPSNFYFLHMGQKTRF